jgi:hypothetical protein
MKLDSSNKYNYTNQNDSSNKGNDKKKYRFRDNNKKKFRALHKFRREMRRSPRGCFECGDTTHLIVDCSIG